MATQEEYDALANEDGSKSWEQEWIDKWTKHFGVKLEDNVLITNEFLAITHTNVFDELEINEFMISREQYEKIREYGENGLLGNWNNWRENFDETIFLMGADLQKIILELKNQSSEDTKIRVNLSYANLQLANLWQTKLRFANFWRANLKGATLRYANLQEAWFEKAKLQRAKLQRAELTDARFPMADLQGARLEAAQLQEAKLYDANLRNAELQAANLTNSQLQGANLQGAKFIRTNISKAQIDMHVKLDTATDFTGSNLADALIDPGVRGALEYNIRQKKWHELCKPKKGDGCLTKIGLYTTRWFWSISDYGISTVKIIRWFMLLAIGFGILYFFNSSWLQWPENQPTVHIFKLFYCIYFSVVTMTTLGFGDIHANPHSPIGQFVLMGQVILGYVLLGALVTRMGVVFTGLGPVIKPELSPQHKRLVRWHRRAFYKFLLLCIECWLIWLLAKSIWLSLTN